MAGRTSYVGSGKSHHLPSLEGASVLVTLGQSVHEVENVHEHEDVEDYAKVRVLLQHRLLRRMLLLLETMAAASLSAPAAAVEVHDVEVLLRRHDLLLHGERRNVKVHDDDIHDELQDNSCGRAGV